MNLSTIFGSWHQSKLRIENVLGIDHDILHIFIGLAVWLLAATLTRRSIASPLPIVVLLVAALFNEAVDLWVERWPDPVEQYGEGAKDIALTMAIPLALMMLARRRPAMFRRL